MTELLDDLRQAAEAPVPAADRRATPMLSAPDPPSITAPAMMSPMKSAPSFLCSVRLRFCATLAQEAINFVPQTGETA